LYRIEIPADKGSKDRPNPDYINISKENMMTTLTQRFSSFFLAICLLALAGCASGPQKEGTGQYIDDSVITAKVKAAIVKDETLKATEINVETFKGVVQLSGFVASQTDINHAVQVARGVEGVKSVKNAMSIKPK
jgi:hypothetical protein